MSNLASNLVIDDPRLEPIAAKVLAGQRLDAADGLALYRTPDLLALGWLANHVREQRHGNVCYFNVNRHINPTNVCVAHCKLSPSAAIPTRPAPTPSPWRKSGSAPSKAYAREPPNSTWSAACIPTCPFNISST